MELTKEKYLGNLRRRLKRLESIVQGKAHHRGNEINYTYWGGFDMGYLKGKIAEIKNFIADIEEGII